MMMVGGPLCHHPNGNFILLVGKAVVAWQVVRSYTHVTLTQMVTLCMLLVILQK